MTIYWASFYAKIIVAYCFTSDFDDAFLNIFVHFIKVHVMTSIHTEKQCDYTLL